MNKKSKGAASSILLILGVVLAIVIIVVFVVIKINASKTATKAKETESAQNNEPPPAVYQAQLGDINFTFELAQNVGSVLKSKDPRFQPDLTTTEKFIKVVIGAQNKGKVNIKKGSWDIGNIVDSEGRNFVPVNQDNQIFAFANNANVCGALLKPEFEPTLCEKYYEVSKGSTDLKVEIDLIDENSAKKKSSSFLDLIVE